MKKIAIFAIFLMATIMTFGQLVPDQQFLTPARVKSLTTKFTRLIPAKTIVYVDVTPYVLDSTGYVGNTLSNMILKGTAVLQSGAVAASFVAVDSSYLHSTGTEYGYGTYTWDGTNTFVRSVITWLTGTHSNITADTATHIVTTDIKFGTHFYGVGDTLKPTVNNTGWLGTANNEFSSIYSNYIGANWLAGTKVTGSYTKFTTDSVTTVVVATTLKFPGGTTATAKSTNGIQFQHSIATGASDTIFGGVYSGTGNASIGGNLTVTGTTTHTGVIYSPMVIRYCTTPKSFDSTGTLTAAHMLRGVIKCSATAAVAMTTPSATAIAALIPNCGQGTRFELYIDNSASTASGVVTLTLDGSITVANPVVVTGSNTLTVAIGSDAKFTFYYQSGTVARIYREF